jgi:hypothetical protein
MFSILIKPAKKQASHSLVYFLFRDVDHQFALHKTISGLYFQIILMISN